MKLSKMINIPFIITWSILIIMLFCIWEYAQILKNQHKDYINGIVKSFLQTTTIPYRVHGSHVVNLYFKDVDILKPYLAKPSDWDINVNKYEDIQIFLKEFQKYVKYSMDFTTVCHPFKNGKPGYVCRLLYNNLFIIDIAYDPGKITNDAYVDDNISYETFDVTVKEIKRYLNDAKLSLGTKYYRPNKILKYQKICDYINL